jgi:hypothetical protein
MDSASRKSRQRIVMYNYKLIKKTEREGKKKNIISLIMWLPLLAVYYIEPRLIPLNFVRPENGGIETNQTDKTCFGQRVTHHTQ